MSLIFGVLCGLVCTAFLLLLRLLFIVKTGSQYKPGEKGSVCVLVVAGSGGHTTEILRLLQSLSPVYSPRHYVIAETDRMSEEKICTFENSRDHTESKFTIHHIPRSREVCQSWSSSVVSTLHALCYSIPLVFRLKPDVVLCNGPGTCVPLCAAGLLFGILGLKRVLIVYVESICRVETLSLSGKLLYPVSDYFFVQWPSLRDKYPKSIFIGRIV